VLFFTVRSKPRKLFLLTAKHDSFLCVAQSQYNHLIPPGPLGLPAPRSPSPATSPRSPTRKPAFDHADPFPFIRQDLTLSPKSRHSDLTLLRHPAPVPASPASVPSSVSTSPSRFRQTKSTMKNPNTTQYQSNRHFSRVTGLSCSEIWIA
jgi:hypothetical protein